METTLAAIRRDAACGGDFQRATRALLAEVVRMGGVPPATADMLAFALRRRPGLLREPREPLAPRLVRLICQQIEAAWRGDQDATAWCHRLLPPLPDRRRKHAARGRAAPVTPDDMLATYTRLMRYCHEVHARVRTLLRGRRLPSATDRRTRAARLMRGDAAWRRRSRARQRQLAALAAPLAQEDAALGDPALLDRILAAPGTTAKDLTVEYLKERAHGHDLRATLEKVLVEARKADREARRSPRGPRRGTRPPEIRLRVRRVQPTPRRLG